MLDNSILLVEDNQDDEELIKQQFRLNHVLNPVVVVRDGEEVLDYLMGWGNYRGRDTDILPGLILLDLGLPKLSGFDVLRQLQIAPFAPQLSVVALSGSERSCAQRVMHMGAKGHVEKPLDFGVLEKTVRPLGFQWLRMKETMRAG